MIVDAFLNIFGRMWFGVAQTVPAAPYPSSLVNTTGAEGSFSEALLYVSDNFGIMAGWLNIELLGLVFALLLSVELFYQVYTGVLAFVGFLKP